MKGWLLALMAGVAFFSAERAHSQIQMHDDYGGYTLRTGNMVTVQRNNGYNSTYMRSGNIELYNNNLGTSGSTIYTPSGRFYNYSNPYSGWTGTGFAPQYGGSTYQRTYTVPGGYAVPRPRYYNRR